MSIPDPKNNAAARREANKTDSERAQDIAYTINHAFVCTTADVLNPFIGNLTQNYLGKRFSVGCGHDHSKDLPYNQGPDCPPVPPKPKRRAFTIAVSPDAPPPTAPAGGNAKPRSHLKHWWIGELVGDFAAVPLTVGVQRFFPSFMHGLKQVMEPVLGPLFHMGAQRATKRWAKEENIDAGSSLYQAHQAAIYRYEIDHLPQALLWTASSVTINLATQKFMGNEAPLWQLAVGKAMGASISTGLVIGTRGAAPGAAHRWDAFAGAKFFLPATRAVSRLFGVDRQAVETMAQRERDAEEWRKRVDSPKSDLTR